MLLRSNRDYYSPTTNINQTAKKKIKYSSKISVSSSTIKTSESSADRISREKATNVRHNETNLILRLFEFKGPIGTSDRWGTRIISSPFSSFLTSKVSSILNYTNNFGYERN